MRDKDRKHEKGEKRHDITFCPSFGGSPDFHFIVRYKYKYIFAAIV